MILISFEASKTKGLIRMAKIRLRLPIPDGD